MKKLLIGLIVVFFPAITLGASIHNGQTITLEEPNKNPIIFSSTANVNSDVEGDLTVFAKSINLQSKVSSSAYLFGQDVMVSGPIENRLIIASNTSSIKSEVKGDLIILSGDTTIESSAKIDGDVIAYGSNVKIKGKISGNLRAGGARVSLDGAVVGSDSTLQSDQILLSDNSQINGNLNYLSSKEISLNSKAVKGNINYTHLGKNDARETAYNLIGSIVMLIILALVLLWLFRPRISDSLKLVDKKFSSVWLTGLLAVLFAPIIMMVLLISYVGIYVFAGLLIIYLFGWLIGYAYSAIILGYFIVKILTKNKDTQIDWSVVVFGSVALVLIGVIPVVGGLVKFLLLIAGFGLFVEQLKRLRSVK